MEVAENVKVIPADYIAGAHRHSDQTRQRVAAYARVSTEFEEQEASYEIQVQHYADYIKSNPGWIFAGVYADDGISATNTAKRDAFNRLIDDCREGKIDMILTKSISRFSRNTMDCLKYTRELKELGIAVFFEKENINTMDTKGEVMMTIMAALAQQESESLSQNVRMGIQFRNQAGKVQVNHKRFLGYTKDDEGKLIVDPAEAEVVKRIYAEYLNGASLVQIRKGLEADGILNGAGNRRWHESNIHQILTNEKYIGDALLQKTFTKDLLEKKRCKNNGQLPKYYVEGDHEPIIDKDIYRRVQVEIARRSNIGKGTRRMYSGKYALSNIVFCGHCGEIFRRLTWQRNGSKYNVWRCLHRIVKDDECSARTVKEKDLHVAIVTAVNDLWGGRDWVSEEVAKNANAVICKGDEERLKQIDQELVELQKRLLTGERKDEPDNDVKNNIFRLRDEQNEIMSSLAEKSALQERITEMNEFLNRQQRGVAEYSEDLARKLVEKVYVFDEKMVVEFKSGIKVEVDG